MGNEVFVREVIPIDIKDGYLIDGFPYTGLANAIATESLVNTTSQFELAGVIDSELFPPISIVRDEVPNFPARILVNKNLKVAVFSSYLTPHESIHRDVARAMLKWASDHKCSFIISSSAIKSDDEAPFVIGVGSTEAAKKKLHDVDIPVLKNGTIPGIPGILLNEGMLSNINVIVLLCKARESGPDFKAGADICMAMSKLVPGSSCNLDLLLNEAKGVEENLKQTEQDAGPIRDAIYG
ncbi:MAG TPA: PAC2 family protein [Candidatus Nitrosotalea sp.]|nr:PAC2 family protein [Candidatus Nitrosotalea sp.]